MKGGLLCIHMITKSSFRLGFTLALEAEKSISPGQSGNTSASNATESRTAHPGIVPNKAGSTVNFRYRQQGDADTFAHFCQVHIFRITLGKVTLRR
jgi:hypothetical protein